MQSTQRALVIYTGGTIGMKQTPRGYAPVRGYLAERLASMPLFHEPGMPSLTTPASRHGRRVQYDILEYDPLLDSSNMGMDDWVKIARDVERNYDAYDAFIVLHGTDTMAWTASALSYALRGLDRPVVLTGSQRPLGEVRTDARRNLIDAVDLATRDLPEVGICFDGKLLRGNRALRIVESLAE